jgi:hypothetical protein
VVAGNLEDHVVISGGRGSISRIKDVDTRWPLFLAVLFQPNPSGRERLEIHYLVRKDLNLTALRGAAVHFNLA